MPSRRLFRLSAAKDNPLEPRKKFPCNGRCPPLHGRDAARDYFGGAGGGAGGWFNRSRPNFAPMLVGSIESARSSSAFPPAVSPDCARAMPSAAPPSGELRQGHIV